MSKTEIRLTLLKPLDEQLLQRLASAHSIYGLLRAVPEPGGEALRLTFDATRLTELEVISALRRAGLPVTLSHPSAAPSPL